MPAATAVVVYKTVMAVGFVGNDKTEITLPSVETDAMLSLFQYVSRTVPLATAVSLMTHPNYRLCLLCLLLWTSLPRMSTAEKHVVLYTNKSINDRVTHNEILFNVEMRNFSFLPLRLLY